MSELLVIAFFLVLAVAPIAIAARRRHPSLRRIVGFASVACGAACTVLIAAALANRLPRNPPQAADVPLQVTDDDYVSSGSCRACHPRQYSTWHASYHRTMTQTASPASVIGDFDDVRLRFEGESYRLFEENGQFFGEMDSRNRLDSTEPARRVVVPLKQTTGSHHMQIYWYPAGQGRSLNVFPVVYLRDQQRWIPRTAAFVIPPEPGLPGTAVWNRVCIECHATHSRPRIRDPRRGGIDSHVSELGIACEACHGAGRDHVDANRAPARRYQLHFSSEPDPTIVDPGDLSHVRSTQVCGQCHVVKTLLNSEHFRDWMENGSRFRPGDDLEEAVNVISNASLSRPVIRQLLERLPEFYRSTFWADGIVRVSGREYNALIESTCFQRGEMSCLSCHTMHKSRDDPRELSDWADDQLSPGMRTDHACIQCHGRFEDEEFVTSHTHHPPSSSGSECQNCHMPHTTYGLLKAIRSHEIGSPRLLAGPGGERPNACNLCHLDRSLGWSADALGRWYGQEAPALTEDDQRLSAGVRWALEGDAGVRALVAWSMGWRPAQEAAGTGWLMTYLAELMNDPYPAVRIIAYRSLKTIPGLENAEFDELAGPQRRVEAAGLIRDRRESASRSSESNGRGARTLFDSQGRLKTAEFQRLLANRDNRRVSLAE